MLTSISSLQDPLEIRLCHAMRQPAFYFSRHGRALLPLLPLGALRSLQDGPVLIDASMQREAGLHMESSPGAPSAWLIKRLYLTASAHLTCHMIGNLQCTSQTFSPKQLIFPVVENV